MIFGNKRGETEIIAQILFSAKNKVKKTHLLYSTNISYSNSGIMVDILDLPMPEK